VSAATITSATMDENTNTRSVTFGASDVIINNYRTDVVVETTSGDTTTTTTTTASESDIGGFEDDLQDRAICRWTTHINYKKDRIPSMITVSRCSAETITTGPPAESVRCYPVYTTINIEQTIFEGSVVRKETGYRRYVSSCAAVRESSSSTISSFTTTESASTQSQSESVTEISTTEDSPPTTGFVQEHETSGNIYVSTIPRETSKETTDADYGNGQ